MEKQHPIPFCPGIHDMAEMKDGLLARLRLPGGQLSANKAQLIADLAAKFGSGEIDLTNRANLQLRGITEATKTPLLEHLLVYDLVSKDPVHDRLRNITIDPLSGLLEAGVEELIDCTALAFQLDDALATLPGCTAFSPKLSFIIDGGGPSHIAGLPHDFAFIARQQSDETITFDMTIKGRPACLSLPQEHLITGITAMLTGLAADPEKTQDASQPIRIKSLITEIGHEALVARIAASLAAANAVDLAPVSQGNNTPPSLPTALNPLIGAISRRQILAITRLIWRFPMAACSISNWLAWPRSRTGLPAVSCASPPGRRSSSPTSPRRPSPMSGNGPRRSACSPSPASKTSASSHAPAQPAASMAALKPSTGPWPSAKPLAR